jgi:hypothetical protein
MLELRRDDLQLFFVSILYCYIYINDSKFDSKTDSKLHSKKDSRLHSMFYNMPNRRGNQETIALSRPVVTIKVFLDKDFDETLIVTTVKDIFDQKL